MSESAFRQQLNSWRNSLPSAHVNETANQPGQSFFSRLQGLNPFRDQYVQLPVTERGDRERDQPDIVEEPSWFTLSRWDRLLIFGICLLGAAACFALCFFILPVLALKPRKFAVLWSLGSMLFIISFATLQGPLSFVQHVLSPGRLAFTGAYFGSIFATLFFSLGMKSTILTLLAVIVQVIAAIWYAVSYFPMGSQSLRFASRMGARQVTSWINS